MTKKYTDLIISTLTSLSNDKFLKNLDILSPFPKLLATNPSLLTKLSPKPNTTE